jgi:hypothetical protein
MQRKHLLVKVFSNGNFVASFGVRDSKAIGNFNLKSQKK